MNEKQIKLYEENCFEERFPYLEDSIKRKTLELHIEAIGSFAKLYRAEPLFEQITEDYTQRFVKFHPRKGMDYNTHTYGTLTIVPKKKEIASLHVFYNESHSDLEELLDKFYGRKKIDKADVEKQFDLDRISEGEYEWFSKMAIIGNFISNSVRHFEIFGFRDTKGDIYAEMYTEQPEIAGYIVHLWNGTGNRIENKLYIGSKEGEVIDKVMKKYYKEHH